MTESVELPERIWIESEGGCPYFYHEDELSDVGSPVTEYVRADKLRAEIEALRAEVERLHRISGRIVGGDGDSTLTIRAGEEGRMNFFLSCPIKGVRKSYALWVESGDQFQPLVYFQKPKWIKDDAWEKFIRGVFMAISPKGHVALKEILESAVLESAVLDREASND